MEVEGEVCRPSLAELQDPTEEAGAVDTTLPPPGPMRSAAGSGGAEGAGCMDKDEVSHWLLWHVKHLPPSPASQEGKGKRDRGWGPW